MKLEGSLPVPTCTATFLQRIGHKAVVIVHGSVNWKQRLQDAMRRREARK